MMGKIFQSNGRDAHYFTQLFQWYNKWRSQKIFKECLAKCIINFLIVLTLYINAYDFIFGKQQKYIAKKICIYIFINLYFKCF